MNVTLNAIRAYNPCQDGWEKLLKHLGKTGPDHEPLSLITILDSNGVYNAAWCVRALPPEMDGKVRLYNCAVAEPALKYWEAAYPDDKSPHETIAVSRRFAIGEATQEELKAASAAMWAPGQYAVDASAARDAAWAAAWGTARAAAWGTARAAARAAALAAGAAAEAAEREYQEKLFREYFA